MKTVITYGTFDLFHTGHLNLLKRAKALGDRLIVGVTSDAYDLSRGKLNVLQTCAERIENVRLSGLADLILVEEAEGQKIQDIQKYNADIFAIGSDWIGKFDYLSNLCNVVYLERTKGVSSSNIRNEKFRIIRMGLIGHGRIVPRFLRESKYVSGIEITSVYGRSKTRAEAFAKQHEIAESYDSLDAFLNSVDAVYIAVPHHVHVEYARKALQKGKHVLCEKPMALTEAEVLELQMLARENACIIMEAVKTAYAPAFSQLIHIAKSGAIGTIKAIDASFTKLVTNSRLREYDPKQAGGALTELASYPFLVIAKLLGTNPSRVSFIASMDKHTGVDTFTRAQFIYRNATATATVAIGAKREGDLCISGTKGYIYVPAPWWKTESFEICHENPALNKKHFTRFADDGLRYELAVLVNLIQRGEYTCNYLTNQESAFMARLIEQFRNHLNVDLLSD